MNKDLHEEFKTNYQFKSQEFCDICGVNRGALRAWCQKGILDYKIDPTNNYTIFDTERSFADVCGIKIMQSIGLTLKEISNLDKLTPEQLIEVYGKREAGVLNQIELLKTSLVTVRDKIAIAKKIINFQTNPNTIVKDYPYKYIYPQNIRNKEIATARLNNKLKEVSLIPFDNLVVTGKKANICGYTSNIKYNNPIMWKKSPNSRFFYTYLCQKKWSTLSEANNAIIIPQNFVSQTVLDLAPNRKEAENFDITKQPTTIYATIKILKTLGFAPKNMMGEWLMNVSLDGEWVGYHDIYIEF